MRDFAYTSEGKELLQRHSDHHGVQVLTDGEQTVVPLSDFEVFEDTPLGYEDCEHFRLLYTDRSVLIRNDMSSSECSVTLMDCFARGGDASAQFMVLDDCDQEVKNEATMDVSSGRTKELKLRCIIPETFKGIITRWILMKIRKSTQANALSIETFEWICGILITFTVRAETKPLSVDARPFTPQQMRVLFDHPVASTLSICDCY